MFRVYICERNTDRKVLLLKAETFIAAQRDALRCLESEMLGDGNYYADITQVA
jgi:hypothetical protein